MLFDSDLCFLFYRLHSTQFLYTIDCINVGLSDGNKASSMTCKH